MIPKGLRQTLEFEQCLPAFAELEPELGAFDSQLIF